jgi:DNA-binding CsgD family transcriptional regulator
MNGLNRPRFGADEKHLLRTCLPHLERALEIYARIQSSVTQQEIFAETLDRLTIGTFILDGRGDVICLNKVATNILQRSTAISLRDKRLVLASRTENKRLAALLHEATRSSQESGTEQFIDVLQIDQEGAAELKLMIRAAPKAANYRSDATPSIIIYADDSNTQKFPAERLIAQLFSLTPSEASLAILLANGFSIAEAARELGFTENTARTYVKCIFEKNGVNRQTDLVRLISKSIALLS